MSRVFLSGPCGVKGVRAALAATSGNFSVFLRTVRDAVDYEVDPSIGPAGYRIRGSPRSEQMRRMIRAVLGPLALVVVTTIAFLEATPAADQASAAPVTSPAAPTGRAMTAAECTAERLGATVASSAIGEPVRNVTLSAPSWVEPATGSPRIVASTAQSHRWTPTARRGRSTSAWCCPRRGVAAPHNWAAEA